MTPRWLTAAEIEDVLEEARNNPERNPELVEAIAGLVREGLITCFIRDGEPHWITAQKKH